MKLTGSLYRLSNFFTSSVFGILEKEKTYLRAYESFSEYA